MSTTPDTSAAIYVRLSRLHSDDLASKGRSLSEKETETRAMAERLGLTVVEVFEEREGTGASRRSGKRRTQWERALAGLDSVRHREPGERGTGSVSWALRAAKAEWSWASTFSDTSPHSDRA